MHRIVALLSIVLLVKGDLLPERLEFFAQKTAAKALQKHARISCHESDAELCLPKSVFQSRGQNVGADVSKNRVLGSDRTAAVCDVCCFLLHHTMRLKLIKGVFKAV